MDFEVEPTRVTPRSNALPLLAAVLLVGALATAIAVGDRTAGSRPRPASAAGSSEPAIQPVASSSLAAPSPVAQSAPSGLARQAPIPEGALDPALVHCHDLSGDDCLAIARAALDAVRASGSATDRVDVWPSILCSDLFDCPRATLARLRPLGSAVVHVQGRKTVAWVNVGAIATHAPPHATDPAAEAWIVRWFY